MKKESIRRYLFKTVVFTLLVITTILFGINIILTMSVREEYIFHELEEARDGYNDYVRFNDQIQEVVSFVVTKDDQIKLISPKKIEAHLKDDLQLIVDDFNHHREDEGVLNHKGVRIYYLVESKDDHDVYYVVSTARGIYLLEFLLVSFVVLLAVFIASNRISKYLSKPVQDLVLYSDQIAKKNWQAEMKEVNNLELSYLAEALVKMKDQLEQADKEERQFFQATSHDLKTPVMIIKGYAQASIDKMPIKGDMNYDEVILKESERLERKVNQLVRLNTIGYTLEHTQHFDLVRVDRILKSLVQKFDTVSDVSFDTDLSPYEVDGDSDALMIAFENIIENQIRYAKSKIIVKVKEDVIYIGNDGPHFDEEPAKMFEIYKKGKSGQFGLGLAITKKVIHSHHGTIEAYNEEEGICFEIRLPLI